MTKTAFVRAHAHLSNEDLLALAKKKRVALTRLYLHNVRHQLRRQKARAISHTQDAITATITQKAPLETEIAAIVHRCVHDLFALLSRTPLNQILDSLSPKTPSSP